MDFQSLFSTLLTFISTYLIVCVVCYILLIIAWWKIFTKAGEAGWKSLIPLYNVYVLFKISWKTLAFWIVVACMVVSSIIGGTDTDSSVLTFIGWACGAATTIITIVMEYKLAKSFGHGIGFAIGLIIPALQNIFTLILAFGKSQYIGPEGANSIENT